MKKLNTNGRRVTAKNLQRGMSMISLMLAVVVGGFIVKVVYDQFSDSSRLTRIDAAKSEITTMISQAKQTYGTSNQYGAVTTAIAVQGGVVPARLRVAGTNTAQNKYNGAITFAPATITTANDSLSMTYAGVRSGDCQDLVVAVEDMTRAISVNGVATVKPNDGALAMAALSTNCDAAATVPVVLTFGRQ